jgi:peptide/nickel transport system permease protein
MRLADVIMSFPSLLLAVIVLYMLEPSIINLVIVLAITRIPIYLRTTRAEVLEIRERMFVQAARVMGASDTRIVLRHILPVVVPSLVTIATLDFAFVMLAESSLSFLGIGIQPPEVTWGLMVAQGRPYLAQAWWLALFPGLAIVITTMSLTLLSGWMRTALDPVQRWRLDGVAAVAEHILEVTACRSNSIRFMAVSCENAASISTAVKRSPSLGSGSGNRCQLRPYEPD